MDVNSLTHGDTEVIRLSGRFIYSAHQEFLVAVDRAVGDPAVKRLHVDFGAVDGIDCSALGLLLVSRDVTRKVGKPISLGNATGIVKRMLVAAKFEKLFVINRNLEST